MLYGINIYLPMQNSNEINYNNHMRKLFFLVFFLSALPGLAQQDAFEKFKQQQNDRFNQFKEDKQAEYDAFRKRVNDEYAEFMRKAWKVFPVQEVVQPIEEKEVPPVVYEEPQPQPAPQPQPQPQPKEDIKPLPSPKPTIETQPVQIPVKPKVEVVPQPAPAPEPIAPVKPKEAPYKKVSIGYYGSIITVGFPENDALKLKAASEKAIADAWQILADSRYDITVSSVLNARKNNSLCDWAYMKMLQAVTEKQYGKTNEAVLAQAFLMTQSGYRVRIGMSNGRLCLLVASQYAILGYRFYKINGSSFYDISGEKHEDMQICESKYEKEKSLSLQIASLPKIGNDPSPKRTLTSKKGVTASVSVNKNLIDFFNTYPQASINGNFTTRWAAYANTPVEKSVKDMLYPPLKKTISGMNERDAVGILLNWVQTAFEYGYDDKIWGRDRAFFAQETLYYPYSDCEDRAILFSRLVRDLVGMDVVLLYYPGHLAAAVAFNDDVNGDWLTYKQRRYVVCDPTYINAGVGRTMPGMNNQEAQVIALK